MSGQNVYFEGCWTALTLEQARKSIRGPGVDHNPFVHVLDQDRPVAVVQRQPVLVTPAAGLNRVNDLHRQLVELVVARVVHLNVQIAAVLALLGGVVAADVTFPVCESDQVTRSGIETLVTNYRTGLEDFLGMKPVHDFLFLRPARLGSAGTTWAPDFE